MGRDLPPDPARSAVPPLRGPGGEPRRAPAPGGQGRPQRRDDGQLPDDPREHPRERPRDVHRPRPERRPPARQRRQPPSRQPHRLDVRGDPRRRRGAARGPGRWTPASASLPPRAGTGRCRCASGTRPPNCASGPSAGRSLRDPTGRRIARPWHPRELLERRPAAPGRARAPRARAATAADQRTPGTDRAARRQAGVAAVLEQLPRAGRQPGGPPRGRRRRHALGGRRRGLTAGVGDDDDPRPPRGAAGRIPLRRLVCPVRVGLPRQHRRRRSTRRPRREDLLRRAQPRLDHRRLPAGPRRGPRLPPPRPRPPRALPPTPSGPPRPRTPVI